MSIISICSAINKRCAEIKETIETLEKEGNMYKLVEVIQEHPEYIQYLKVQTDGICRVAVTNNPMTLKYVRVQTEELCRIAVSLNGLALKYVRVQTEELCRIATSNNKEAAKYVKVSGASLLNILSTIEAGISIYSTIKYLKFMKRMM